MASVLWHASGSSFVLLTFVFLLLLCPRITTAREVIDAPPLPQQDLIDDPLVPPPPGPSTTANTSRCDQRFMSYPDGPQNGTFQAPYIINGEGETRQCVYTFFAGPNQRVEVFFTNFGLRGTPPDGAAVGELPACFHEYMDIYSEIRSDNTTKLIDTPFGGRYCGPITPRRRVSLYQGIALSFYTQKNVTDTSLFEGRYSFINASEYEIGTPIPSLPCSFIINSAEKKSGNLLSPTYPGIYPKDMVCSYQFIGNPSQRIRIEFRDFDLFFGGLHCPFDYVKIYDGINNTSAVIGTYCGQQRNLVLYSSASSLFVLFVTLQRTANTQNRGFKGIYEFSDTFVKLDFIKNYGGEHIGGTECDQKILSRKESSGLVVSPGFPFPYNAKIVCRYFIYGMQDSQHLERVRLEFQNLDIPKGEAKGDSQCSDGYLKLYLKGQEATESYDKHDHEYCGNEANPSLVVSEGPRLVMVFSSGDAQGRGFKATYTFETEYKIPGTASPDGSCTFTYRSSSRKKGEYNSPRYPSNYPSDTNCTYMFLALPDEQVTLVFDYFKIRTSSFNASGHYGPHNCQEDWLEIYNVYRDNTERMINRYCGLTAPGPIESNIGALGVKAILHSDAELVYSGFKARYIFHGAKDIFGDCGANISSLHHGVITSPNFPKNYDGPARNTATRSCNWFINVRPNHRILVHFDIFSVEGDPSTRGCPASVLRLWLSPGDPPVELCGIKEPDDKWFYVSTDNNARLSFLIAGKAVGQQGFRIIWTEVTHENHCGNNFYCSNNGYCIDDSLRCNGIDNCGPEDSSDEENCIQPAQPEEYYALPIGTVGFFVILTAFAILLVCHRRLRCRSSDPSHQSNHHHDHSDDFQRVDERTGRCFHHHHHHHHQGLLEHQHHHHDIHDHPYHHHHHHHHHQLSLNHSHEDGEDPRHEPSPQSDSDVEFERPDNEEQEEIGEEASSSPESCTIR